MFTPQFDRGQPFDAEKKRLEILQRLQDHSLGALRELGAAPMTSGVTRPLPAPTTGAGVLDNLTTEVVRGVTTEGPRFLDRHSTDAASTYRNTRYDYFANHYGARSYAYDKKTGRRVNDGTATTGETNVGINFNMDHPDARGTWAGVFGNSVSFDDVKNGKAGLTIPQIQTLFDSTIQGSEAKLSDLVDRSAPLTENQRLAMLDTLVQTPEMTAAIKRYGETGNAADFVLPLLAHGKTDPTKEARAYTQATQFVGTSNAAAHLPDYTSYKNGSDKTAALLSDEEGFAATPYWDVNAWRTGFGSDTVTKADGTIVRVTKGMGPISKEDAQRDLARRIGEFSATVKGQTGSAYDKLGANTQAALTSVAYNYGSLPKSVVAAVKSGDTKTISDAVASLSANPARRKREGALIMQDVNPNWVNVAAN